MSRANRIQSGIIFVIGCFMKEMFLFGAGASVEAGVPDSYGLTERILNGFETSSDLHKYARIVNFIAGGLLFQNSILGLNPLKVGVNVENLFNAIDILANRHTLEAAPFVGSWHFMIDEFDKIEPPRPNISSLYDVICKNIKEDIIPELTDRFSPFQHIKKTQNRSEFSRKFSDAVNQESKPGKGQIFDEVAEYMTRSLVNIAWIDNINNVSYLIPLLEVLKSQNQLTIASLNYDNSVELLCKNNNVVCNTGIEKWPNEDAFKKPESGLLLLKLHGSIDWSSNPYFRDEMHSLPYTAIKKVAPEKIKESGFRPAVIFGHKNKLTADGPFLDLLRIFQYELNLADRLTIVGYSFSDEHINVYLSNWINQGKNRKVRIINPEYYKISNDFTLILAMLDDQRLEVIEKRASEGLQTI